MKRCGGVFLFAFGLLGSCAFVNEVSTSFDAYRPIPLNSRIGRVDLLARARLYASSMGYLSPSDSGVDFVKYDNFVYRSVNVVYSCALAFADIRDTLKVGLRKCKILDADPKTKSVRWLDYGVDAPGSHRQAITDHFWYTMIDTANSAKDSAGQSLEVMTPARLGEYVRASLLR